MNMISIIVPTLNEADNITDLTVRIDNSLKKAGYQYEIIVIDDNSQDGIERKVSELQKKYPVKIKIRFMKKGLSSAVIAGFEMATGDIYLVMDADLSHSPEKIPDLVYKISKEGYDFVIGSRFIKGGSAEHFNIFRILNALVSRIMARPFTSVKDPMSGFFAFRRGLLKNDIKLNPVGFKIGIELLVKLSPEKIAEIPIQFHKRLHGESKLTLKQQVLSLLHICRLFHYKYPVLKEFIVFCIIGTSGMIVDLAFVFFSYDLLNIRFRIARIVGFVFALTSNYLFNRKFNFPKTGHGLKRQYISFFAVSLIGFTLNWLISVYLFEKKGFFYMAASFLGIAGGLTVNFLGSKFFVFRKKNVKN